TDSRFFLRPVLGEPPGGCAGLVSVGVGRQPLSMMASAQTTDRPAHPGPCKATGRAASHESDGEYDSVAQVEKLLKEVPRFQSSARRRVRTSALAVGTPLSMKKGRFVNAHSNAGRGPGPERPPGASVAFRFREGAVGCLTRSSRAARPQS